MQNIDYDLRSVQEVRDLARLGQIATEKIANYTEDQIDRIIRNRFALPKKMLFHWHRWQ